MTDLVASKPERVSALSSVANFEAFRADIILLNGTPCPEGGNYPISSSVGEQLLPRADAIARAIEAAQRPATREEIAAHLALLMANFPNGKADEHSTSIMLDYIFAIQQPSIGALKWAVRHLICTVKDYQPVTAGVMEAIKEGTKAIRNAKYALQQLPKRIEEDRLIRARHEEAERQRKLKQEETRAVLARGDDQWK